ncbi:MAG: hypothetical protein GX458_04885, partial [Phyllobacteriaceae bacterium]|nr:hypothetical protein [Phyllobacteriaceae bacterium]
MSSMIPSMSDTLRDDARFRKIARVTPSSLARVGAALYPRSCREPKRSHPLPRRSLRRSSLLSRRFLAAVMIGVVVLLGVSACLTRGGADASSSAGPVVATTRSAADAPAKPVLRRCAFALFAALSDRR